MARPTTVDMAELTALRVRMSTEQLAQHFRCSERTISRALGRLGDQTPRTVLTNQVQMTRAVEQNLNAMDYWFRIHGELEQILARVKEAQDTEHLVQVIGRYQKSFDQLLKLAELLNDVRAHQQFQDTVLAVIEEVSPDARAEIERRLNASRALFISLGGRPG